MVSHLIADVITAGSPLQKSKQLRAFSKGVCSLIMTEGSIFFFFFCQAAIHETLDSLLSLKITNIPEIHKGASAYLSEYPCMYQSA